MPRIWTPQDQWSPPVGARVNWAHPLARDLLVYCPINEGRGYFRDIVGGGVGTRFGGTFDDGDWKPTFYGPGVCDALDWPGIASIRTTEQGTFAIGFHHDQANAYNYPLLYVKDWYSTTPYIVCLKNHNLQYFWIRPDAGSRTTDVSFTVPGWGPFYHFAVTGGDSSGWKCYYDGVVYGSGSDTTWVADLNAYDTLDNITTNYGNTGASLTGTAPIAYLGYWGRVLSQSELQEIAARPFCFLDCPTSKTYIVVGTSGGGGETGVSDTFKGEHEALKKLLPTYTGGHEAMKPLSDTFDGNQEAWEGIAATKEGAHEAMGAVAPTYTGGHEAQQGLSDTFEGAHEAWEGVSDTFEGEHEAQQGTSDTFAGNHEAKGGYAPIYQTCQGAHEALQGITDTFEGNQEAMKPVSQTFTGNQEGWLLVETSPQGNHEAAGFVYNDPTGGHEAMEPISKSPVGNHEATQHLYPTYSGGQEAMAPLSDTFSGNHEADSGFTAVSQTFTGNHEAGGVEAFKDMDVPQIFTRAYDQANNALRITNVGTPSGNRGTMLDWEQVIKSVYDATNNVLRVTVLTS